MFVAVLLGSCAKNGEYKDCDRERQFKNLIDAYPNAEICKNYYYLIFDSFRSESPCLSSSNTNCFLDKGIFFNMDSCLRN